MAAELDWPFGVVALSPDLRGATVEPTLDHAMRRLARSLRQIGEAGAARELPESRTWFALNARRSYCLSFPTLGLTLAVAWLAHRAADTEWPEPTIVAGWNGHDLIAPTLAPNRTAAAQWQRTLIRRGLGPEHSLILPADDRRASGNPGRIMPTMEDPLAGPSPIEHVLQHTAAQAA